MKKNSLFIFFIINIIFLSNAYSDDTFEGWKVNFKKHAIEQGISMSTVNKIIDKATFLPNVIKYDRYQPEFYEDTKTYISKRTSNKKIKIGRKIYNKNFEKINSISIR